MARSKKTLAKPWESPFPSKDKDSHWSKNFPSLHRHKAFRNMRFSSRELYSCACAVATERQFHLTKVEAEEFGFNEMTFRRAIKELISNGFIRVVRSGKTTRTANIYEFIDEWKEQK